MKIRSFRKPRLDQRHWIFGKMLVYTNNNRVEGNSSFHLRVKTNWIAISISESPSPSSSHCKSLLLASFHPLSQWIFHHVEQPLVKMLSYNTIVSYSCTQQHSTIFKTRKQRFYILFVLALDPSLDKILDQQVQ